MCSGFSRSVAGGLGEGATIADYMGNLSSYNIGAFSSENNENSEGDINAFSMKGKYLFDSGYVTSIEGGIRYVKRSADYERYHLFSPVQTAGCMAQWKATDVLLNADAPACSDGEMVNGEFMPYAALESIPLDQYNNVVQVTDFGPVSGIPAIWAVDPADLGIFAINR